MSEFAEWAMADAFPSEAGTVTAQTAETSPDGLAANAITRRGSTFGNPWVFPAAGDGNVRVTTPDPVLAECAFIAGSNLTDAAVVLLRGYPTPMGVPVTIGTLTKCRPANLWLYVLPAAPTAYDDFLLAINDDTNPEDVVIPFAGWGPVLRLPGWIRPKRDPRLIDPSTRSAAKSGAVYSLEQTKRLELGLTITDHFDSPDLDDVRDLYQRAGTTRPVLACLNPSDVSEWASAVLGLLGGDWDEAMSAGFMSNPMLGLSEILR